MFSACSNYLLLKNSYVNQRHPILICLFMLLFLSPGIAQQANGFDLLKDNIELLLPPLETILDSALKRNPDVKFRDMQVIMNEHKLKAFKADWTRNLGIQTDALYGTFDNISSNTTNGGSNPAMLTTKSSQLNYGAGAFIKIPLYNLINRKNQNKLAKAEIEQAQNSSQAQRNVVRQLVIKQYNEVILKHRLLKIKSRYAETAKINLAMAEKQFLNGVITVAEYSSTTEIVSRSETDFESSKMEFRTAFMLLEEIVGIKFNLTSK